MLLTFCFVDTGQVFRLNGRASSQTPPMKTSFNLQLMGKLRYPSVSYNVLFCLFVFPKDHWPDSLRNYCNEVRSIALPRDASKEEIVQRLNEKGGFGRHIVRPPKYLSLFFDSSNQT